jgi:hypothetical protein
VTATAECAVLKLGREKENEEEEEKQEKPISDVTNDEEVEEGRTQQERREESWLVDACYDDQGDGGKRKQRRCPRLFPLNCPRRNGTTIRPDAHSPQARRRHEEEMEMLRI